MIPCPSVDESFLLQWYSSYTRFFHRCFNVMDGDYRGIVTDLHLECDGVQTERHDSAKRFNLFLDNLAFTGTAKPFDLERRYLNTPRFVCTAGHGSSGSYSRLCLT